MLSCHGCKKKAAIQCQPEPFCFFSALEPMGDHHGLHQARGLHFKCFGANVLVQAGTMSLSQVRKVFCQMPAQCWSPSLAFIALEGSAESVAFQRGGRAVGSSVRYGRIQPACACLSLQAAAKDQALGESSPCPVGGTCIWKDP